MENTIQADLKNTDQGVCIRVTRQSWCKAYHFRAGEEVAVVVAGGVVTTPDHTIPLLEVQEIAVWRYRLIAGPPDVCWRREGRGPLTRIPATL
jgi:hypothetical protein